MIHHVANTVHKPPITVECTLHAAKVSVIFYL